MNILRIAIIKMKSKGIEIKGGYEILCGEHGFKVYDKNGNEIYYEDKDGWWSITKYDENNYQIYFEDSDGSIDTFHYDEKSIKEHKIYLDEKYSQNKKGE